MDTPRTEARRRQATGDWRLATGDWRLATGDWRLGTREPWPSIGKIAIPRFARNDTPLLQPAAGRLPPAACRLPFQCAPWSIHFASMTLSRSVMFVRFLNGIVRVSTARTRTRAANA